MGRPKIKISINCKKCEKSFTGYKYRIFCSKKCFFLYNTKQRHWGWKGGDNCKKVCAFCRKKFLGTYNRKFCSILCGTKLSSKGEKNCNWKGGRTGGNGRYVFLLRPDHPFVNKLGYIPEHRYIMEQKIKRYLTKKEVVHHINGKKDDNRIENLILLKKKQHDSLHMKIRHKNKNYPEKCSVCERKFYSKNLCKKHWRENHFIETGHHC